MSANDGIVTFVYGNNHGITLDLDYCDDLCMVEIFNGNDGNPSVEIGDEESGFHKAKRFFVGDEEVSKQKVIELILVHMLGNCDGYHKEELVEDLARYGIDFNSVEIPEHLIDFL